MVRGARCVMRGIYVIFVSGAYAAQKHSFTCLGYLENIENSVTDQTYCALNNIVDYGFIQYELIPKYLTTLRNFSFPEIPAMNISLPDFGWNVA